MHHVTSRVSKVKGRTQLEGVPEWGDEKGIWFEAIGKSGIKLHSDECHDLYCSLHIVRQI